jgi:hypothetical protein
MLKHLLLPLHRHGYSPIQRLCQYILFSLKGDTTFQGLHLLERFKHGGQPMQSGNYQPFIKFDSPLARQEQRGGKRL